MCLFVIGGGGGGGAETIVVADEEVNGRCCSTGIRVPGKRVGIAVETRRCGGSAD